MKKLLMIAAALVAPAMVNQAEIVTLVAHDLHPGQPQYPPVVGTLEIAADQTAELLAKSAYTSTVVLSVRKDGVDFYLDSPAPYGSGLAYPMVVRGPAKLTLIRSI